MKSTWVAAAVLALVGPCLSAQGDAAAGVIQTVALDPSRPYFVPTHVRVTTTIRFPGEIGAPDGSVGVFTEDAVNHNAEYLVTWQQGDRYLTLTPVKDASLANLNIPYQGQTYVFYFYPVAEPLKAVASVNLVGSAPHGAQGARQGVTRENAAPEPTQLPLTPSRLLGFVDRLKLIHATPVGPSLAELALAMRVQIAIAGEDARRGGGPVDPIRDGVIGDFGNGVNDAGLYQIVLVRAVRDERTNCIGYVCLVRNTSRQVLAFDVSSFGARAGAEYLDQRISDAVPILKPGEQAPAYFVVQPRRNSPLLATNHWRITVDLVSPRLNPGAALTREFGTEGWDG